MPVLFQQLPPEVHLIIMYHCPDMPTLLTSISTIPQFRRIYLSRKHRILAAVIQNYFGLNLSRALYLLNSAIQYPTSSRGPRPLCLVDLSASEDMWPVDYLYLSVNNVKRLLDLDSRMECLIRECIYLQFGKWIQLSSSETYSIRRGMYNFLYAALLSRKPAKTANIQTLTDFYLSLEVVEVLEILYILYCLRDVARDHFRRLSDYLFDQITNGFIVTDFQTQDQIFGTSMPETREQWCINAPWMLDLAHLNSLTTPVSELEFHRFHPEDVLAGNDTITRSAPFGHFDPMEDKLKERVPTQYDWNELAPNHTQGELSTLARGYHDLFSKIPTGFMIWNKDHRDLLCARQSIPKEINTTTVLGRLRKWSWTVHSHSYVCKPGQRKYPRGEPDVIGQIEYSRNVDSWSAEDYQDLWPFVRKGARRQLRELRDEYLKMDCDLPFKIDWKKGILMQVPYQDWAACNSLGSW